MNYKSILRLPWKFFVWIITVFITTAFLVAALTFIFSSTVQELGSFASYFLSILFSTVAVSFIHGIYVYFFLLIHVELTEIQREKAYDIIYSTSNPPTGLLQSGRLVDEVIAGSGNYIEQSILKKLLKLSKRQNVLSIASFASVAIIVVCFVVYGVVKSNA